MPFVILEGPNGVGKTSLVSALKEDGYSTLSSPNGTPLAQMLRSACRGVGEWADLDKRVQFMLFSAARYDEYLHLVHGKKEVVIADRWWTSTYVYQCMLQGIEVEFLELTKHPEEKIDLVILLDGNDEDLLDRVKKEREANPAHGNCRWTQEQESQRKLIDLYRKELPPYLKSQNISYITINTSGKTKTEVKAEVVQLISDLEKLNWPKGNIEYAKK
jgi:thymidylate kinase